jgi:hypothetical protein
VQLEGLRQLKNPMISSGLDPATFRLVAQCLNQLGYRVPPLQETSKMQVANQTLYFLPVAGHLVGLRKQSE